MRTILHILTRHDDPLPRQLLQQQATLPEVRLEEVDLTVENPDYAGLVERIFAADSVQVW